MTRGGPVRLGWRSGTAGDSDDECAVFQGLDVVKDAGVEDEQPAGRQVEQIFPNARTDVPRHGVNRYSGGCRVRARAGTAPQHYEHDPEIGIFGMDVSVSIQRPGKRVARRRVMRRSIPHSHRMTRPEAMEFIKQKFNVEVID